jgi:hypothetical protein
VAHRSARSHGFYRGSFCTCTFFVRNLHLRMPLVPTPARTLRTCV